MEVKGSRSWFEFGPVRFQPAEVSKITTSLLLAFLMSRPNYKITEAKSFFLTMLVIGLPMIIILGESETGSALVYVGFIFMLYREGLSGWFIGAIGLVIILFIMTLTTSPYASVLAAIGILSFCGALNTGRIGRWILIYASFILVMAFFPMGWKFLTETLIPGASIGFIKQVNSKHRSLFNPNLRIVVGIPSGSTEVEIRAVRDSSEHAGGRDVFLIYEPMAAALGIGLDVEAPKGNMVVDIGGGTTEIAVISLGGIVEQDSIRTAGDVFTSDIQYYLKQQHNIKVGEITAEKIKIAVGAVIPELDDEPEPFIARGPNLMTAHPVDATITYQEIAHCLDKSVAKIESSVLHVLEQTPPELYSDIVENGIFLSGGGALLRGLDKRLSEKVNIPFHVAEDPLRAVARGTCIALKNAANYSFLMR